MKISTDTLRTASKRGMAKRSLYSRIQSVRFDARSKRLVLSLSSGLELVFAPDSVPGLENARAADMADYEISPSGLGVHFPKRDADLYLPSLLSGFMGSTRWLAGEMGKLGGSKTSAAKERAAKANGKLGGRPRKAVD